MSRCGWKTHLLSDCPVPRAPLRMRGQADQPRLRTCPVHMPTKETRSWGKSIATEPPSFRGVVNRRDFGCCLRLPQTLKPPIGLGAFGSASQHHQLSLPTGSSVHDFVFQLGSTGMRAALRCTSSQIIALAPKTLCKINRRRRVSLKCQMHAPLHGCSPFVLVRGLKSGARPLETRSSRRAFP